MHSCNHLYGYDYIIHMHVCLLCILHVCLNICLYRCMHACTIVHVCMHVCMHACQYLGRPYDITHECRDACMHAHALNSVSPEYKCTQTFTLKSHSMFLYILYVSVAVLHRG